MSCLQAWPEPIVRVQSLSESGMREIPERYVKRPSERPDRCSEEDGKEVNIPVIDLSEVFSDGDPAARERAMAAVDEACREWGFFQVVKHGVNEELMLRTREAWREFFRLPVEEKQAYANLPATYEGYGSRLGVEMGGKLDWSDYFFLHYLPHSIRDPNKWPKLPTTCRELVGEYGDEVAKLCGKLNKILSVNLGLEEDHLEKAFGGEDKIGACMRVNFYPKCPQPDLTLGLSPHSDPGGITLLLPDDDVAGLQVRRGSNWLTVKPIPNAFIVNIGDQIQVISNAIYKSVEHRVMVNSAKERVSLAFFYNPTGDIPIRPAKQLVKEDEADLYHQAMTFNDYRLFIREKGLHGKLQLQSLINSPPPQK
ncbi:jasmonate-induced oxygenase 2-like [Diospyros lotus]|uniref:jasmonate-induced oxygenase 2-like n=1 Tax=Diospyros lotus TaxID=55363 RepID=UPI00224F16B1|nr:jasmonate-induced oxygenase 2-like [Diospyros lotus]